MEPVFVIPCGGAKSPVGNPARDLYIGSMFRHTLATAETLAGRNSGRVLILSALHGLVTPDTVLAPYDLRMTDRGSVTPDRLASQGRALGIGPGVGVYLLLPRAYRRRLAEALARLGVSGCDLYSGCGGIGQQKARNVALSRSPALMEAAI